MRTPLALALLAVALAAGSATAQDSAAVARPDGDARAAVEKPTKPGARKTARPDPVWPVPGPAPRAGALLPGKRIVAFYGNPLSKRMGILGELPPDSMLARLDREVAAWQRADSSTPVQPALHMIAVVAQADAGADGKYRLRMGEKQIEKVLDWASRRDALVFLDVQLGLSTLAQELPRLAPYLKRPNVHLGIDPEFAMHGGARPGTRVGHLDAKDVNYAVKFLSDIAAAESLPPKVLVVHRFTRAMLTNAAKIQPDSNVQVVVHMDGWGPPAQKRDTYRAWIWREPVQYTGFKLFFKNDRKKGSRMMSPEEILALTPRPVYIQYQ